jgi:hypothetical protein
MRVKRDSELQSVQLTVCFGSPVVPSIGSLTESAISGTVSDRLIPGGVIAHCFAMDLTHLPAAPAFHAHPVPIVIKGT